jgi:glycosyltransferase involved in cell wall biosynthesis
MAGETGKQDLPLCSVVICTRDRPVHLEQCLAAVSRQDYPRFFTVVVDNASRDGRARDIAARWGARYVAEPTPGLSRARNRGVAASESEVVAYLDDDALPAPDWLSKIIEGFQDPSVMLVTGRVRAPDTDAEDAAHQWLIRHYEFGGPSPVVVDSNTPGWFELVNFQGVGLNGNMALRKQAFEVWGGFDTRLGRGTPLSGGEEIYAFFSLIVRGYKLAYTPRAEVRHPCLATKQDLWARYLADLRANAAYSTLLFFEEPRYRKAILAYKLRSLVRRLQNSGSETRWPGKGLGDYARTLSARLSGPWLYLRSRWACLG